MEVNLFGKNYDEDLRKPKSHQSLCLIPERTHARENRITARTIAPRRIYHCFVRRYQRLRLSPTYRPPDRMNPLPPPTISGESIGTWYHDSDHLRVRAPLTLWKRPSPVRTSHLFRFDQTHYPGRSPPPPRSPQGSASLSSSPSALTVRYGSLLARSPMYYAHPRSFLGLDVVPSSPLEFAASSTQSNR